ncbi:tetratricopeptide repeat protein [Humisphaera borealis]|uniref:Tetratricopeptide repeat protein n=1 Tax=Humisphaera borealis TaxID=2807512 RepID=A0A7M2WYR7_9BACT|nr:tetratricopeptide repeat protein [Humisphaera borealis]QOV90648.1 tetratricopeptide repeat protein [Humisphaera borealis]
MRYRLRPSFLQVFDDLPYYPGHVFDSRWKQFLFRGTALVLIVLAVYAPVLLSQLLWVDSASETGELFLRSSEGLARLWTSPGIRPAYQPLSDSLLWLQYQSWGSHPLGFHLVSLVLHALNALLVWIICRRLSIPGGWLVATLFALHPTQAQAVAWVGGQGAILATTFLLSSLLMYLRFARIAPAEDDTPDDTTDDFRSEHFSSCDGGPLNYLVALTLFGLALLAGSWTWITPLVLILLLWWRRTKVTRADLKPLLPFLLLGLAACVFHAWRAELYASRQGIAADLTAIDRILLWGRSFWFYLAQLAVPSDLLFVYSRWEFDPSPWWQYLFPPAVIITVVAVWRWRLVVGRGPVVAVLSFAVCLLPTAGLVRHEWMRYAYVGDHLAYLARLGPIALLVAGLIRLTDRATDEDFRRFRRSVGGALLITTLGTFAFLQAQTYADAETLWRHVLASDPSSTVANRQLAKTYMAQGRTDLAARHLRSAVADNPDDVDLVVDWGAVLEAEGTLDEAEKQLLWAIHLDPANDRAYRLLASINAKRGKDTEALRYVELTLRYNLRDATAHGLRGAIYRRQKQPQAAIDELNAALELDATLVSARLELADLLFQLGRLPESAEQLQELVRIDPRNFDAFMKAGDLLGRLNDFARAERMFRSAVRVRPTSAEAHNNLGAALATQGRVSEAIYCFAQAVRLKPDFASAQKNLAWATARREADVPASLPARE